MKIKILKGPMYRMPIWSNEFWGQVPTFAAIEPVAGLYVKHAGLYYEKAEAFERNRDLERIYTHPLWRSHWDIHVVP
jgi:hypothetical protein